MLATVTNRARSVRGLCTCDQGTVLVEPGASAVLDLADHPLHRAWALSGEVAAVPLSDKDAKAARRRFDTEAEARRQLAAAALASLPPAHHRAVGAA